MRMSPMASAGRLLQITQPAEGIVLRHPVQGDQRPAGGRGRDGTQGYALGGGIGARRWSPGG